MARHHATIVSAALALAACGAMPATPEQRRLAEQRLLAPFTRMAEVACLELQIDITPNFHANVGQPAVDPAAQTVTREQAATYRETVWTNVSGAAEHGFVLTIGVPPEFTEKGVELRQQTTFRVVNQVRLRVHEDRRPMTLNVRAGGGFAMLKEADGARRDVEEYRVADGVATTR